MLVYMAAGSLYQIPNSQLQKDTNQTSVSYSIHRIPAATSSELTLANQGLQDLSGRSRTNLKQYFEDAQSLTLPLGHPKRAFTESQLYHLLRIITNETVSLSYNNMENTVLAEVKRDSATSKSRTDHFHKPRHSNLTPGRTLTLELSTKRDFQFQDWTLLEEQRLRENRVIQHCKKRPTVPERLPSSKRIIRELFEPNKCPELPQKGALTVIEKNPSQNLKFYKKPLQRLRLLGKRPSEPRKEKNRCDLSQ